MARPKIELDHEGIGEILNSSKVRAEVSDLGAAVEGNAIGETADGEAVPIESWTRTASGGRLSPRQAVEVTMAHPAGLRIEAKRGTLARAASSAGLEVVRRPVE